jgi:hypothetical protein
VPAGADVEYKPMVVGVAEVAFVVDKRKGKEHTETQRWLAEPPEASHPVEWEQATAFTEALDSEPLRNALWEGVPESLNTGRKLKALEKGFADYLYSTRRLSLLENRKLDLVSDVGESEASFRQRCHEAAAEEARQALEMEKAKFAPKFKDLGMDLPEDDSTSSRSGGSILGWLFSPFLSSQDDEAPPASREEKEKRKLKANYQAKQAEIHEKWKRIGKEATSIQVKPRKVDVRVTHFGLAWVPSGRPAGAARPAK